MTRRPRDSQRTAVYRWQYRAGIVEHGSEPQLTLEECRGLAHRVWQEYPTGPRITARPTVVASRTATSKRAGYWYARNQITLPPWALQAGVVLHEVAHGILASWLDPRAVAAHGPRFVRVLAELAIAYMSRPPVVVVGALDRARCSTTHKLTFLPARQSVKCAALMAMPWRQLS